MNLLQLEGYSNKTTCNHLDQSKSIRHDDFIIAMQWNSKVRNPIVIMNALTEN